VIGVDGRICAARMRLRSGSRWLAAAEGQTRDGFWILPLTSILTLSAWMFAILATGAACGKDVQPYFTMSIRSTPPMGICVWVIAWFGVALALDFTKAASLGDSQVTYSPREQ